MTLKKKFSVQQEAIVLNKELVADIQTISFGIKNKTKNLF
jgi:hypothetical protein